MAKVSESLKKLIDGSSDYVIPNDCPYIGVYGINAFPFANEEIPISDNMIYLGHNSFNNSSLKNIDFTNASSLYVIDDMSFYGSKLKNVILPPNIVALGNNLFAGCKDLKSVLIPSSIKYMPTTFCDFTTQVTICIDKPENSISGAPWGATSATVIWNDKPGIFIKTKYDIDVFIKINGRYVVKRGIVGNEGDVVEIRLDKDGYNAYDFTFTLTDKLTIYDIDAELEEMGLYEKVMQCEGITEFSFDEDVTYLSDCCFTEFSNLKTLDFSKCTQLTYIGRNCFYGCRALDSLDLSPCPNLLTLDGSCFAYCTSLKNPILSDSITTLGKNCFYGCTSLTDITLPSSLETMGDSCFYGCTSLKEVVIPNSVTTIGPNCFDGCSSLTNVTLPNSLTTVDDSLFRNCSSLKEVVMPDSVTTMGMWCFGHCSSLQSVQLSNSLTSIGIWCFASCSLLETITIPSSVTTIEGAFVFDGCLNLKTIIINKPKDSIGGAPWGAPGATVIWNG